MIVRALRLLRRFSLGTLGVASLLSAATISRADVTNPIVFQPGDVVSADLLNEAFATITK